MSTLGPMANADMHARLVCPFPTTRRRAVWVRSWESQGISENEQMRLADDAEERESASDRSSASDD
jgi:hypothetical protein